MIDSPATVAATTIVTKSGLGTDPEVQTFEDAVCLTFLRTQLTPTVDRLEPDRMVEVVAKTLAKMSDRGRAEALRFELDDRSAAIVARGVERFLERAG